MSVLVFDIGVTKTRVAVSHDSRRLRAFRIIPTNPIYRRGVRGLMEVGKEFLRGQRPDKIIGGFAGPLDDKKRTPLDCLSKDWIRKPLASDLERVWKRPVRLENDATLNGLGEAVAGAGRQYHIVGFLTVSTGVNGVRIVDRQIDENAHGYELGYFLVPNGQGGVTSLGSEVSGWGIERRFHRRPEDIRQRSVWTATAKTLAVATVNLALAWSPEVIVFGGPLFRSSAIRISDIRSAIRVIWKSPSPFPPLLHGHLGDTSGLIGALALARQTSKKPSK